MKNRIWFLLMLILVVFAAEALAAPVSPGDIEVVSSSRREDSSSIYVQAQAGNVSELFINLTTVTTGWQGYFGNVTGTIVLDDANNNTMYSWDLADPEGEIFATRDSDGIDWGSGNVICADISHIETEETTLNFNSGGVTSRDGINETFSFANSHPAFTASANSFAENQCDFTVSTYVDDAAGIRSFNETLLYSTSDTSLIYAALIFPGGSDGFRNDDTAFDFQMLVAEDGHSGNVAPTNYYFYEELS